MKKFNLLLMLCALLGVQLAFSQDKKIEVLWESKEQLPTPESVLYYAKDNVLFVSLIDGSGSEKDGKGGIAQLNTDGTIKNAAWVTGLNAPKGLAIHKGLLYIADITDVIVVDVVTGNVIDEIAVEGATFLNDVTVDNNGIVYISDTRENKIFQLRNGKVSLYLDNVPSVNGLKAEGGKLLALTGKEFWSIDANKKVTVFTKGFDQGGDGLEPVGNGDYIVTCWVGLVYYVKANGEIQKMLDVQGKMNTADLGYNQKEEVLYIPTFNSNSVVAYKLK
ncbi:ATP-binding protein [Sphingobacterium composti Ten et al. 2007 non Yoo et al. 2007]|uniref:ATP-binding protein n=1 Tax=Sphingobacterium composti TaxID=363260 RepID=UPI00135CBA51|nr:ATP-binding protein [Sphingobacterium composti Ten et al. 2007 non Yoo et al. 2007]